MLKKILIAFVAVCLLTFSWVIDYFFLSNTPVTVSEDPLLIRDVTQLNPQRVRQVLVPTSEQQIQQALQANRGPVSIGGGRFSQGGHTAQPDGIQLDLRKFNQVLQFDAAQKQIRVQAGITWRDLQEYIDPANLSVQVMQTYANFTVGGSLSVNAHGRYIGQGALVHSVLALRLLCADGSILTLSPQHQPEIFYAVIGGYGGLGVILDVSLQLADNIRVARDHLDMPAAEYPAWFVQEIRNNPQVIFHNADLFPPDYQAVRAVSWRETDLPVTVTARLHPRQQDHRLNARLADFVADYQAGKWLRQHVFEPLVYRTPAVHWRNYEASYDVAELEPASRTETTYALREYFVPVAHFAEFTHLMSDIFQRYQVNVLNVSVRHAKPDLQTVLSWAPQEVFAFVVYYRQGTDQQSQATVDEWSRALIDAALSVGGRYYLPYQPSATPEQFARAYPGISTFRALKQRLDPANRFSNSFWQKYLPAVAPSASETRSEPGSPINGKHR